MVPYGRVLSGSTEVDPLRPFFSSEVTSSEVTSKFPGHLLTIVRKNQGKLSPLQLLFRKQRRVLEVERQGAKRPSYWIWSTSVPQRSIPVPPFL